MNHDYEVVGILDAEVADAVGLDADTILVEHDDPTERLVCRPKADD